MVVCKIELWPFGEEENAQEIGRVLIHNDTTGNSMYGNYVVRLMKAAKYATKPGVWKRGVVHQFPRIKLGPYDLLYRALKNVVGSRND